MKVLVTIVLLGMSMFAYSQTEVLSQQQAQTTFSKTVGREKSHIDEDFIRLQDLEYWSGLIEDYERKTGYYPLQNTLDTSNQGDTILVNIQGKDTYVKVDYSKTPFREEPVNVLITELSNVLNRPIEKRFDRKSKLGYKYFTTNEGYLLWVVCIKCGVTPISTLLMDGTTPTVNIASKGMVNKVHKAQTRKQMLNHPLYKAWLYYFDNKPAK